MKKNITPRSIPAVTILLIISSIFFVSSRAKAGEEIGVKIMRKEAVGEYLADSRGIALYSYKKDEKNTSRCLEGCAVNWPPFYADPTAGTDQQLNPDDLGVITRADGRLQTTYRGMPLYYFRNDRYTGDTFGQGIGEAWFLIFPDLAAILPP